MTSRTAGRALMRAALSRFATGLRPVAAGAILFLVAFGLAAQPVPEAALEASTGFQPKAAVHAKRFLVVAAHPLASRTGYDVIRRGGNALDAAIAVQLVLNLVEPQSSGIGGGSFLLYYSAKERRVYAYDGRETAPAAAKPDRFLGRDGR